MGAREIRPQPGPQEAFLASRADIVIYGGAAFGGKTWAAVVEPLRHVRNSLFRAVIFRRTSPQITNPGGLWDEASAWYPLLGAKSNRTFMYWDFPSGMRVQFAHLQYEDTVYDWQGTQVPLIIFDELTHFTEKQFWYMMTRNRSMSDVPGYVRATVNPDADSWVAGLLAWWIDPDSGYARPDRAGAVRYFVRKDGQLLWGDTAEELCAAYPELTKDAPPKSLAFIPAALDDNPIGVGKNPGYRANLLAQDLVTQERLLKGNWKIKPAAGKVFNEEWFEIVGPATVPRGGEACRFWDLAATEKSLKKPNPDYTAGVLLYRVGAAWYIVDCIAAQIGPAAVEELMLTTAAEDRAWAIAHGAQYRVRWELEPAAGARMNSLSLQRALTGYDAQPVAVHHDKVSRSRALAATAKPAPGETYGGIKLVEGGWNAAWKGHMHAFPDGPHDDIADASGGGYSDLAQGGDASFEPGGSLQWPA